MLDNRTSMLQPESAPSLPGPNSLLARNNSTKYAAPFCTRLMTECDLTDREIADIMAWSPSASATSVRYMLTSHRWSWQSAHAWKQTGC